MDNCRLHYTRLKDCVSRQLGHYRRTKKGNINVLFTSCLRPEPCKHWLSDDVYEEAQKTNGRHRQCWEARIA